MKAKRVRIMLVDDHTMVRRGLATFLKVYDDLELAGEAASVTRRAQPAIAPAVIGREAREQMLEREGRLPDLPGGYARPGLWAAVSEAVRDGKWKLVRQGPEKHRCNLDIPPGHGEWELYDMEADRTELDNLAGEYPEIVAELDAVYDRWAARCGVQPWSTLKDA